MDTPRRAGASIPKGSYYRMHTVQPLLVKIGGDASGFFEASKLQMWVLLFQNIGDVVEKKCGVIL